MASTRILVVDDDAELGALLREYLAEDGFEVELAFDGVRGLERACSGEHAIVVLDVMLPGMNGLEVLRQLRRASAVPLIMLTARGEETDRIVGLELGADDYLPKPFNPRELVARMRAVLRRAEQGAGSTRKVLTVGDVTLDVEARVVRRSGEELTLTGAEFVLLTLLLESEGRIVDRETISEKVLGRRWSATDRSIDVHVSNLRGKLGPDPDGRRRIETVRGTGYVYASQEHDGA